MSECATASIPKTVASGEFIISQNLTERFEREYERKTVIVAKICDFCAKRLPAEFVSTKCSKCDTIFDECDSCCRWPRIDPTICHKPHTQDNSDFSAHELASIDAVNAKPRTLCRLFGMTYAQRTWLKQKVDDGRDSPEDSEDEYFVNTNGEEGRDGDDENDNNNNEDDDEDNHNTSARNARRRERRERDADEEGEAIEEDKHRLRLCTNDSKLLRSRGCSEMANFLDQGYEIVLRAGRHDVLLDINDKKLIRKTETNTITHSNQSSTSAETTQQSK